MKRRTTYAEAEREGLRALANAALNPPKAPDVEADERRVARAAAKALGHDLGPFRAKGSAMQLTARCVRCKAAVVFRERDAVGNPATGEFFGGSAVSRPCK